MGWVYSKDAISCPPQNSLMQSLVRRRGKYKRGAGTTSPHADASRPTPTLMLTRAVAEDPPRHPFKWDSSGCHGNYPVLVSPGWLSCSTAAIQP